MSRLFGHRNQAVPGTGGIAGLEADHSVEAPQQLIGVLESQLPTRSRADRRLLLGGDVRDAGVGVRDLGQAQQVGDGRILTLGVEAAILSDGKGRSALIGTGFGAGAGAMMGAIFGAGKGTALGSIVGGAAGPGTTAFRGAQKISLPSALQMTIQIT